MHPFPNLQTSCINYLVKTLYTLTDVFLWTVHTNSYKI
jgi:hypothetical protein